MVVTTQSVGGGTGDVGGVADNVENEDTDESHRGSTTAATEGQVSKPPANEPFAVGSIIFTN